MLKKRAALVLQLPLIASLWLWREPAKAHLVVATLAFVGYEILVLLIMFGRKVWGKLEDRAVDYTANWILSTASSLKPGFHRRYNEQVINLHGIFNVRGLGSLNTSPLSLEQVYVDLRVDPTNPQKLSSDPIARKGFMGNRPIWDFLRLAKKSVEATALAVIGPAGCGKTTLLQHVAVTLAANRQHRHGLRAHIPILLSLRDHIQALTQERPPPLGELIQDHFSDGTLFSTLKPPPRWFERQLGRGKCIVLLDGLDEVGKIEQRRSISAWVETQIRNYPRCRFVLTARPQGYRDAPLLRAHVLEVQPFTPQQVRRFIENWYIAHEVLNSGKADTPPVRQRALADAHDLLKRLLQRPALTSLTVNPLLLTMIAMVHRYRGALPGSRVALYAEICEVFLGRWSEVKGVAEKLTPAQKLVVLRPLASHMMNGKLRDIATQQVIQIIADSVERVGVKGGATEDFLRYLQETSSGLLLERESGRWSFAHLTFQEYLTAAHWIEDKAERAAHNWGELVNDSWWHETLRLFAAKGDATFLLETCLKADTILALSLAADCLIEAREIAPAVRRAVEERVVTDLESPDPRRRTLAARVRLVGRLNSLRRPGVERVADQDYITCAEYQLFLDDVRPQGEHRQPDHWISCTFPPGQAREPLLGLRAEDAQAFCDWLTQQHGGTFIYRLPRPDELPDRRVVQQGSRREGLSAWCKTGRTFKLAGLAEPDQQVLMEKLGALLAPFGPPPAGGLFNSVPLNRLESAVTAYSDHAVTNDFVLHRSLSRVCARALTRDFNENCDYAFSQLDRPHSDFTLYVNRGSSRLREFDKILEFQKVLRESRVNSEGKRGQGPAPTGGRAHERDALFSHACGLINHCSNEYGLIRGDIKTLLFVLSLLDFSKHPRAAEMAGDVSNALDRLRRNIRDLVSLLEALLHSIAENNIAEARRLSQKAGSVKGELGDSAPGLKSLVASVSQEIGWLVRNVERGYLAQVIAEGYLDHARKRRRGSEREMLTFYCWIKIVMAREQGELPAWEGVQIIQEAVSETS